MQTLIVLLLTISASAEMRMINGHEFITPSVQAEPVPQATIAQEAIETSYEFSPEQGAAMVRASRAESAAKSGDKSNTEYCFKLMHEAVQDGQCNETFFAEGATCEKTEKTGCFENKAFRRKLGRLGFKVKRWEMPTSGPADNCVAIRVSWCKEVRREEE